MHPINTCLNFTCRQVCIYIPRYLFQIRGREITVVCTVYPVEFAYHVYRFINTFAKTYIRQISEPFIGFTNFVVIIAQRNAKLSALTKLGWFPVHGSENGIRYTFTDKPLESGILTGRGQRELLDDIRSETSKKK